MGDTDEHDSSATPARPNPRHRDGGYRSSRPGQLISAFDFVLSSPAALAATA